MSEPEKKPYRFVLTDQAQFQKTLEDIKASVGERTDLLAQVEKLDARMKMYNGALAQAVKVGGLTSGDPIRDFVISKGHGLNLDTEKRYAEINAELAGKTGELMAFFRYRTYRTYGPNDSNETYVQFCIAVLRDDKLKMALGTNCALPIDSYVICKDFLHQKDYELQRRVPEDEWVTFEVLKDWGHPQKECPSLATNIALVAGTDKVRSLFAYAYLTIGEASKASMKIAERDAGLLELESEKSE
ncbi:MAG: hypothetical protein ABA06_01445 [Parcubacteria bacterium C7867-001]|nr:MAG: hypothetical protein ABA06_01445 [Parcubacteria bacterium C7867-001]